MTDLDTRRPEFTLGLRGYDRTQVDDYVEYLQRLLTEAETRAREAETEHVFDAHAAVGPRIAEIFALAEAEARELLERVSTEAAELVSEARKEAEAIIDAAERAAREAKARTQCDHAEMVAELEEDRDRIREEVVALEWRKAQAVGELKRLRSVLGEAAGITADDGTAVTKALPSANDETIELPAVDGEAEEY
jgi:cell division septum initiation protein DivIVA